MVRIEKSIGKRAMNTVLTYTLEPSEEGTKFGYVLTAEMPWGILGRFLGRIGKGVLEREGEKSIENLKNILEK